MAFTGTAVFNNLGALKLVITGLDLTANAGSLDPTGAAADTGLFNSNQGDIDPVPANTVSLPAGYGPGEDNWSQADADALEVLLNDSGANAVQLHYQVSLIANVNPAPAGSNLTNNNVQIAVHNLGAGAADEIEARLNADHSTTR